MHFYTTHTTHISACVRSNTVSERAKREEGGEGGREGGREREEGRERGREERDLDSPMVCSRSARCCVKSLLNTFKLQHLSMDVTYMDMDTRVHIEQHSLKWVLQVLAACNHFTHKL